jgi:predicted alpha/beta-fold hydrolase
MKFSFNWLLYLGTFMILSKPLAVAVSLALYLLINHKRNTMVLAYESNERNKLLVSLCPSLYRYSPTPYLNGFLHTVVASFLPQNDSLESTCERIGTTGITVDWIARDPKSKVLLLIMPGLTGSVHDRYINHRKHQLHQRPGIGGFEAGLP